MTPARRLLAAALMLVPLTSALAACGGVRAPDLFIVYRSGSAPGARLTLLVDEEGGVSCNGHPAARMLEDKQILKAREIQEDLEKPASRHLYLPPRPRSVFSYYLRDENGTVRFSDNSAGQPAVLHELQLFILQSEQEICGLHGPGAS